MGKIKVTDFVLYRWRYRLAYVIIGLIVAGILYITGLYAPGGISETEMRSVVKTGEMNSSVLQGQQTSQLVFLPFRVLQKISLSIFEMSTLSLKLPSLVLAAISVFLFYKLVRLWFYRNVAVISTIILATSEQFLLQSQQATPLISYLFWSTIMLFSASMIARQKQHRPFWLIITAIVTALGLYNPFIIYVAAAMATTAVVHPHARFVVFQQPIWAKLSAGVAFLVLLTPIFLNVISDSSVLLDLLGAPSRDGIPLLELTKERTLDYLNFFTPENSRYLIPAYGLGILLITAIGGYRLFTNKYTAKSYILTIWLVFTLVVLVLNPTAIGFTLLPIMLLVGFGIDYLIRSWYRLFPKNPYARIVGLIPLTILVVGISFSGVERFVYGYHYDKASATVYRNDLKLLNKIVNTSDSDTAVLIVTEKERQFYEIYARYSDKTINVITSVDVTGATLLIIGPGVPKIANSTPTQIVTSGISSQPNRFYVYENK